MAIKLKVSNSIKVLSTELTNELKKNSAIFRPVYIVTQTVGMNNWLKLQIADKLGVAANIRFPKPNDLIHRAYQIMGGTYQQPVSSHDLNWLIFKALDEREFKDRHPEISAYYDAGFINSDQKRMALAEKIADLFDQYQIYRTDVIERWNQNVENNIQTLNEEKWQSWIWRRIRELAGEKFPDKTMVGKYILNALNQPEAVENLKRNLPVAYFFGLSLITKYHLELINKLSEHIDIHFLIQNPAPYDYWFEEKSEKKLDFMIRKGWRESKDESLSNPLLISWGKLIQDTFLLLFEDENWLNHYEDFEVAEPSDDSLLHKIQNSIFHNQKEALDFSEVWNDGSITLNSCFNPVRELEVLYNYLVNLIDKKEIELSAREIVVMISDIDLYASYIKAVFDNAPYRFKYTIADESFLNGDGITTALISVLTMNETSFTSEKVVSLLDFSALRKQFRIGDTMRIRELINAANIRFGTLGHRSDDTDKVSWKYGLQRLMYGICMSGGEEYGEGENSFFPLDLTEGFDTEAVINLVYFVESLMDSLKYRNSERSISEWVEYVEDTLQRFIGSKDEVEDEDYALLLSQLEKYNLLQEIYTEQVSYEVFLHSFLPGLTTAKRNQSFGSGGITFCSLIPMRSIPFKVVALLGLNFNKFPRKDMRMSFDLMRLEKRKADRNLKENDKHLFLETLLSAEKYLYISYTGQSVKNNVQQPPSALVDELIDFILSNTHIHGLTADDLIQKHPLHGFSKKYNSGNENLYSYLLNQIKDDIDFPEIENTDKPDFDEIQVASLTKFFKEPIKAFYNRILKVYYQDSNQNLSETELFELNKLQEWGLKNELLFLNDNDTERFIDKNIKLGSLPLKNKGIVEVERLKKIIGETKNTFHKLTYGFEPETKDIELSIDDSLITGKIDGIFGNQLIRYSFSKDDKKYRFNSYLHYLLLTASGFDLELKFIDADGTKFNYPKIAKETAWIELEKIIRLYKKGHFKILPFDFSFNINFEKLESLDSSELNKKIKKSTESAYSSAYLLKEYRSGSLNADDILSDFIEIAEMLVKPLIGFK